jgi:hypothetical protein
MLSTLTLVCKILLHIQLFSSQLARLQHDFAIFYKFCYIYPKTMLKYSVTLIFITFVAKQLK